MCTMWPKDANTKCGGGARPGLPLSPAHHLWEELERPIATRGCPHTFGHTLQLSVQREVLTLVSLLGVRALKVLRYRVVTLMALWIEALFSPVWLNSNGLRFDFSPGHKAGGVHTTHTHTPAGYLGGEEHAGRRKNTPGPPPNVETDRETTWMITWLMTFPSSTWTCAQNQSPHQLSKRVGLQSENHSIKRESLVDVEREEMRRTIR